MAQCVGAQGQQEVAKIPKHALIVTSPPENPHQKRKIFFFFMSTRRLAESTEGLNSSLALAAGDLRLKKGRPIMAVKGLKMANNEKEEGSTK